MAYNLGVRVGIDGEAQFKAAIKNITQQSKTLKAEQDALAKGFQSAGDKSSAYEKKINLLNAQIDTQKELVDKLAERMKKSAAETGENSTETLKYKEQVMKAQGALAAMESELDNTIDGMDESGEAADKNGERMSKFGDTLKAVGAALAAVAVAAAAAAVELGKEVIKAYGQYEQLVGGVETLFKESAPQVEEYAKNAYKTAGMSANEYMETVTSFSASLITSLGGDTAKAAQYADKAITDMADNANKMGTDVSSLQNAYAGFAKGQYNMLDNLKLGYGGTKAEMERLIRDAESLDETFSVTHTKTKKGADEITYSYADVVEAIHIVQTNLGITGATAAEAENTIEGSINTLKGAFENLIIGLGDANADVKTLADNVTQAFQNVMKNITPVIQNIVAVLPTVVQTFLTAISGMLPQLLTTFITIFNQVLTQLLALLPSIIPVVIQGIQMIATTIMENLPMIIEIGTQIITTLLEGFSQGDFAGQAVAVIVMLAKSLADNFPKIVAAGIDAILALVNGLLQPDAIGSLIDAGVNLIVSLILGLVEALPRLTAQIPVVISAICEAIIQNLDKIIVGAMQIVVAIGIAIVQGIPQILDAVFKALRAIWDSFAETDWSQIGYNIMQGIGNGLKSMVNTLKQKARTFCTDILNSAKSALGIASPSKVFRDVVGKNIARGISTGIDSEMPSTIKDMQNQMDDLVLGASATINGMDSVVGTGSSVANNYGGFVINVNAQDGQSAQDIADEVMYRIQNAVQRREAVFA